MLSFTTSWLEFCNPHGKTLTWDDAIIPWNSCKSRKVVDQFPTTLEFPLLTNTQFQLLPFSLDHNSLRFVVQVSPALCCLPELSGGWQRCCQPRCGFCVCWRPGHHGRRRLPPKPADGTVPRALKPGGWELLAGHLELGMAWLEEPNLLLYPNVFWRLTCSSTKGKTSGN